MKRNRNNNIRLMNGPLPAITGITDIRPYNFKEIDDNSVEVEMYGQVVENRPTDWWTGEPLDGLYIVLAEFLKDLDTYREMDNITFRINSVGGDLYAGIAICNRIAELKGKTVTIVDGLAASAASIILQGGKTRKAFAGSQVMVHGASAFLFGSYNAQDIAQAMKRIEGGNKSVLETYADRTGKEKGYIKNLMEREEWMTGQEAVDNGFVDELINTGEEIKLSMTADHKMILSNGIPMPIVGFKNVPGKIPIRIITSGITPAVIENQTTKTGGKENMTVEEIRQKHPELVQQIENEAKQTVESQIDEETVRNEAVQKERARIREIEEIENKIADKKLVNDAKYGEKPMTAQELAFQAMKRDGEEGKRFLENLANDSDASGVNDVDPIPNAGQKSEAEIEMEDMANAAKMIAGVEK